MYLTLCEESPPVFSDWFTYINHSYATTSSTHISQNNLFDVGTEHSTYTLYVKKTKLVNYGDKMIRTMGPLIWNDLPFDIQDSSSIQTFKIHLKSFLINKYNNQ